MGTQTFSLTESRKVQGGPGKPAPFKLRSSCNACTRGKVGCTKEKPTCARCERRGETCVYVATKRVGRPAFNKRKATRTSEGNNSAHGSPGGSSSHSTAAVTSPGHWAEDTAMTGTSNVFSPAMISHSTVDSYLSDYTDLFRDIMLPDDGLNGWMTSLPSFPMAAPLPFEAPLADAIENIDGVLEPSARGTDIPQNSFSGGNVYSNHCESDQNIDPAIVQEHSTLGQRGESGSSSSVGDLANPAFSNTIEGQYSASSSPARYSWFATGPSPKNGPPAPGADVGGETRAVRPKTTPQLSGGSSGNCFTRAVRLLEQMSPQCGAEACESRPDPGSPAGKLSFEGVVKQNKEALDTISEILACSCSKGAVLGLITLVMYRILGWYAACASAEQVAVPELGNADDLRGGKKWRVAINVEPPSREDMLRHGFLDEDGVEDRGRFVCQFVLSELHVAQRTVEIIAEHLRAVEPRSFPPAESSRDSLDSIRDLLFDDRLDQSERPRGCPHATEVSLRSHLRRLFRAIVEALQGF